MRGYVIIIYCAPFSGGMLWNKGLQGLEQECIF